MRIQENASRPSARNIPVKSPLIVKVGPRVPRGPAILNGHDCDAGPAQVLAPVLPPMARARTAYVVPGTRFVSTITLGLCGDARLCLRLAAVRAALHLIRFGVHHREQLQQHLRGAVVEQADDGRVVQGRRSAVGAGRQKAAAQEQFQIVR